MYIKKAFLPGVVTLFQNNISFLVFMLFLLMAVAYRQFKIDDAYISFVYAKNLVQGHGLTYNGMLVEGYSNFLWTVLIAPFIGLGWEPFFAARILSLVSAGIALFISEKLLTRLNPGITVVEKFLALSILAVSAPFAAWTVGGLETVFMALWVTVFVYCEIQPEKLPGVCSPIAALVCALIRPEGIMLFFILLAHRLIYTRKRWRRIVLDSFIFLIPFSIYIIWRHAYYGYYIPNTALIKLDPGPQTLLQAFNWLISYLELRPLFALLLIVGFIKVIREKKLFDRSWSLVLAVILAFVLFILYSGPDWMPHYRFLVPVLLLFSLLVGKAICSLQNKLFRQIVLVTALGAAVFEVVMALMIYIPHAPEIGNYTDGLVEGGNWIRENTQPQDTIAVVDAGALAYYSERRVIDIAGLNDAHIARSPAKSDLDYVMSYNPKIIELHVAYSASGKVIPPTKMDDNYKMFFRADFQKFYQPYWEGAEEPFFPFFFIRE